MRHDESAVDDRRNERRVDSVAMVVDVGGFVTRGRIAKRVDSSHAPTANVDASVTTVPPSGKYLQPPWTKLKLWRPYPMFSHPFPIPLMISLSMHAISTWLTPQALRSKHMPPER